MKPWPPSNGARLSAGQLAPRTIAYAPARLAGRYISIRQFDLEIALGQCIRFGRDWAKHESFQVISDLHSETVGDSLAQSPPKNVMKVLAMSNPAYPADLPPLHIALIVLSRDLPFESTTKATPNRSHGMGHSCAHAHGLHQSAQGYHPIRLLRVVEGPDVETPQLRDIRRLCTDGMPLYPPGYICVGGEQCPVSPETAVEPSSWFSITLTELTMRGLYTLPEHPLLMRLSLLTDSALCLL